MERPMLLVLLGGAACFTVLFFWLHNLRCRVAALDETTVSE
jgi:hypothetical protein